MIGRAAFFDPAASTVPESGTPPVIRKYSMGIPSASLASISLMSPQGQEGAAVTFTANLPHDSSGPVCNNSQWRPLRKAVSRAHDQAPL